MEDRLPFYKYAETGEIFGGVIQPFEPKLFAIKDTMLVDEIKCTDALMNINAERIPAPFSKAE